MAGKTKVSEQQIREALQCWRGNIAATAGSLGIAENSLRKRLKALGLGPKALVLLRSTRISPTHTHPHPTHEATPHPVANASHTRQQEKRGHIYASVAEFPTLSGMEAETAIQRLPRVRLRPDQLDQLRDAKYDFQAKHRTDVREEDLLQKFFDENFPEWLKRALGRERKPKEGERS